MLLHRLAKWATQPPTPAPIGLELRPDRFALVHLEQDPTGQPRILGYARQPLAPDRLAAADALNAAWSGLALTDRRAVISLPCPPSCFAVLADEDADWPPPAQDDRVRASVALPGERPRILAGAVPSALLDDALTLLGLAELEAAQVQIDALALLTAYSHLPAWSDELALSRMVVHAGDDDYSWYTLAPADGLPDEIGLAEDGAQLIDQLAARRPSRVFLAGPTKSTQALMANLQAVLPQARFCTNPFAGLPLANEEDRRPLTASAPALSVALGLALGACR
jgi:hypothetical protein